MTHELLTNFEGIRYLVLGTRDECEYARTMDDVVSAMAGMDVAGVMEFEAANGHDIGSWHFTYDASEAAALAWLSAHQGELEYEAGEFIRVPQFIQDHCREELAEIAVDAEAQRQHERELAEPSL